MPLNLISIVSAMEAIRSQLARLQSDLDRLSLSGPPRNKRKNRRNRGGGVVAPPVQNPIIRAAGSGKKKKKRNRRNGGVSFDGSLTVAREELLVSINSKDGRKGYIDLIPSKFSWLNTVAKAYERCTWLSAQVYYKPAVGTNTDGLIVYGIDWNSLGTGATRAAVQAYTPVADHPVWQDNRGSPLVLPTNKLQTRKEYIISAPIKQDAQPGQLVWCCDSSAADTVFIGELWIRYKIHFFGTTS